MGAPDVTRLLMLPAFLLLSAAADPQAARMPTTSSAPALAAQPKGGASSQPIGFPVSAPARDVATGPASAPASAPACDTALAAKVHALARQLGDADYKKRESAQRRLEAMGPAALPHLLPFINDPEPEIADRVAALFQRPADPRIRVEAAVRLIRTAEPDLIEMGVYMLFVTPAVDYPLFVEGARGASPPFDAAFAEIAEQLEMLVRQEEVTLHHYEKHRKDKPEAAERIRASYEDLKLARAEAAYWCALEAIEEPAAAAATRPVTGPRSEGKDDAGKP